MSRYSHPPNPHVNLKSWIFSSRYLAGGPKIARYKESSTSAGPFKPDRQARRILTRVDCAVLRCSNLTFSNDTASRFMSGTCGLLCITSSHSRPESSHCIPIISYFSDYSRSLLGILETKNRKKFGSLIRILAHSSKRNNTRHRSPPTDIIKVQSPLSGSMVRGRRLQAKLHSLYTINPPGPDHHVRVSIDCLNMYRRKSCSDECVSTWSGKILLNITTTPALIHTGNSRFAFFEAPGLAKVSQ